MEFIWKWNWNNALKRRLIQFFKVYPESLSEKQFIRKFGYDENNFVGDNFSFKLNYQRFTFISRCEQILLMD